MFVTFFKQTVKIFIITATHPEKNSCLLGKTTRPALVSACSATITPQFKTSIFKKSSCTDWSSCHHIEADRDARRMLYDSSVLPTSSETGTGGVAGTYLARGVTHRDCIDAFLSGNAGLI